MKKEQLEVELNAARERVAELEKRLGEVEQAQRTRMAGGTIEHEYSGFESAKLVERLSLATKAAGLGIWDWNLIKNGLVWDDQMYALYGLKRGEFDETRETWLNSIHPEDRELNNQILQRAISGEGEYDIEFRVLWPDESIHWLKANGQVLRAEDGTPLRMVGVNYEITERKRAEADLKESEERFSSAFATSPISQTIFTQDKNVVIAVNDACCRLFGYSREELIGASTAQLNLWKNPADRLEAVTELQRTGHLLPREATVQVKSREIRTVIVALEPISWKGSPCFISSVLDITERKLAEKEVLKQAELLREQSELLNYAHVLIRDLDNRIVLWNLGMEELYGWSKAEALGRVTHQFLQTEFLQPFEAYQAELMQNGHWEGELTHTRKDGRRITVASHQLLFYDQSGRPSQILEVNNDITERKRAEDALRRSEENFARAFEMNPAALAITRLADGKFVVVNDAYMNVMGYSRSEIIGRNVTELNIYADPLERNRILQQFRERGGVRNYELMVRGKNQGLRILLVSMEPVLYNNEESILSTFIDITQRKEMENALRASERLISQILESIRDGFFALDRDWRITYINHRAASNVGMKPEDAIGKNLWEVFPQIRGTIHEVNYRKAMEEHTPVEFELSGMLTSKSYNIHIYPSDEGISVYWIDITERQQMENLLRESERSYRELVQNANSAIIRWNRDGVITFFNEFAQSFFGYSPQEIVGKSVNILVPETESTGEDLSSLVGNIVARPNEFINVVNENICKDGHRAWMAWTNKPVYDEHGRLSEILAVGVDITEQKQIEDELRRSNAELEQFAYVASHDLQEPLRAVAGMVQLLQQRYKGQLDERADEYIHLAVEAASRMQALINDLLTYSRVDRRGKALEPVYVGHALDVALANLQVAIQESGAQITYDAMPTVLADPAQLAQLFQNLIGNALKFRGQQTPKIEIHVMKLTGSFQFSVYDNGIGIETQYFERIFLVFQRLHTRREYPGTGIGLALCKKIVERHGGEIWVESEPGHGSKFHFTLPVAPSR